MNDNDDRGTVELPRGKIVGGKWLVMKKLGEGGCGSVYLVKSMENDEEAAMKAESNFASGGCVLKLEVAILKKLVGKPHVCQFLCAARVTNYSYVIMTLLGDSLNRISKNLGRAFTVSSQVRIAVNTLFCLKQIHDIGFIHRDLKPANMALGRSNTGEARFFHILDFGLARQFAVPSSDDPNKFVMRRPRDRALFRGTTRYCSIRMHDRSEQGRVDDLWSMIYFLAELRGNLPWASECDKKVVGEIKRVHPDEIILQNSPLELLEIAQHLRSLTYYHRPDYHRMFMLLYQVMDKGKFSWNDPFDWEIKTTIPEKLRRSSFLSPILTGKKSKEVYLKSKEQMSREAWSREGVGMSKENTQEHSREPIEKTSKKSASREEIMRRLPFDPDFFTIDVLKF